MSKLSGAEQIKRLGRPLAVTTVAGLVVGAACGVWLDTGGSHPARIAGMILLWLSVLWGSVLGDEMGLALAYKSRRPSVIVVSISALLLGVLLAAAIFIPSVGKFQPTWGLAAGLFLVTFVTISIFSRPKVPRSATRQTRRDKQVR